MQKPCQTEWVHKKLPALKLLKKIYLAPACIFGTLRHGFRICSSETEKTQRYEQEQHRQRTNVPPFQSHLYGQAESVGKGQERNLRQPLWRGQGGSVPFRGQQWTTTRWSRSQSIQTTRLVCPKSGASRTDTTARWCGKASSFPSATSMK